MSASPRVHHIETGTPGYHEIVTGKAFDLMPNALSVSVGDILDVEVLRWRGYDVRTVRRASHRVVEVIDTKNVRCDPIPLTQVD